MGNSDEATAGQSLLMPADGQHYPHMGKESRLTAMALSDRVKACKFQTSIIPSNQTRGSISFRSLATIQRFRWKTICQ